MVVAIFAGHAPTLIGVISPSEMAAAGIKAGTSYGHSDDWGHQAAEGKTYCYDLHATVLHLLGIGHKRLAYRQNGLDRRLTDVHGQVIGEFLA